MSTKYSGNQRQGLFRLHSHRVENRHATLNFIVISLSEGASGTLDTKKRPDFVHLQDVRRTSEI